MPATAISPARLRELREEAQAKVGPYVDPHAIAGAKAALRVRGEAWAAAVLGRDLSRRSLLYPTLPWLRPGEAHALTAADVEEDRARLDAMIDGQD